MSNAAVVERYRGEVSSGLSLQFKVESNRSADRMNYHPMPSAAAYGRVLESLGHLAGMSDFYAYAAWLAVRHVSPYLTPHQIVANVAEAFQTVIREGWEDTRTATGPEAGRPSSHHHEATFQQAVILNLAVIEVEAAFGGSLGHVINVGWAMRELLPEAEVDARWLHLPNVKRMLLEE